MFVLRIAFSKDKHTVMPHFLLEIGISKDKARHGSGTCPGKRGFQGQVE